MASGGGISGVAVAVASAGALLVYAGFRGVSPIKALKDISTGHPAGVKHTSAGLGEQVWQNAAAAVGAAAASAPIVAGAMKYRGDQYSQARRNSPGYSDCSSFVAKAMKAVGLDPPTPATTATFYVSTDWKTIPLDQAQAGDIVVSATVATVGAHMVIVTGPGTAIGQQNSHDDVEMGSIKDLMAGTRYRYVARRYIGPGHKKADGSVAA